MSSIVLWVSDIEAQTIFYSELFGIPAPISVNGFANVSDGKNAVLVHQLPEEFRAQVPLTKQLEVQEQVAIKPIFTLVSINEALQRSRNSCATFASESLKHGDYEYLDAVDPEGNVIQIRQVIN